MCPIAPLYALRGLMATDFELGMPRHDTRHLVAPTARLSHAAVEQGEWLASFLARVLVPREVQVTDCVELGDPARGKPGGRDGIQNNRRPREGIAAT
jgi:hypothetical protein